MIPLRRSPKYRRGCCYRQAILVALLSGLLSSLITAAEEKLSDSALAEQMMASGLEYNPQPLIERGAAGMSAVADLLFPETIEKKEAPATKYAALIEQLGDESFARREEATAMLRRQGSLALLPLRKALEHDDAEVRSRARKLIAEAETPRVWRDDAYPALRAYLNKLTDVEAQQVLARRLGQAIEAGVHKTSREDYIRVCLTALASWPTDRVHGELLPLLKLEDSAPALYTMGRISGQTGNNYVSALHMGAIASGKPDLIKAGFRSMPCPCWDQTNRPKIKAALEHMFDDSPEFAELRQEPDFMFTMAFVASRDFRMPAGRQWLLDKMSSADEKLKLRAVQSLGDTYYMRNPLYPELLTALEPHLKSKDPKFRKAAIYTLGVYRGAEVQPLLLQAFADADPMVWKMAGERLRDQHTYYRAGQSPIPKLLEDALPMAEEAAYKARLEFLAKYLQQEKPGYLRWPE
jgi:HEAT repeat protein